MIGVTTSEPRTAGGGSPKRLGELRSASAIPVRTQAGQRTLTPIGSPYVRVIVNRSSVSATTACLLASYGGPDPGISPLMLAVLTMWPPPWPSRIGRKVRVPWMTPQRLTPITLNGRLVAHVGRHRQRLDAHRGDLLGGPRQRVLRHVGEHDVETVAGDPLRQCQPDAAGRAGYDRDLPRLELHRHSLPSRKETDPTSGRPVDSRDPGACRRTGERECGHDDGDCRHARARRVD